jgi:hypothetical protein
VRPRYDDSSTATGQKVKRMIENTTIKSELDELTNAFFSLFTNTNNKIPAIENIYQLCIPEAIIIKNTGPAPEVYSLQQFVAPRKTILTNGTLTGFSEEETDERTEIYGNIAHRFCSYKKSGSLSGQPFEAKGMKTIQFIHTADGWKISSVAWDDERAGLPTPEGYFKE